MKSSTDGALHEQGLHLASSWAQLLLGSAPGSIPARHVTKRLLKTTTVKSCRDSALRPLQKGWRLTPIRSLASKMPFWVGSEIPLTLL